MPLLAVIAEPAFGQVSRDGRLEGQQERSDSLRDWYQKRRLLLEQQNLLQREIRTRARAEREAELDAQLRQVDDNIRNLLKQSEVESRRMLNRGEQRLREIESRDRKALGRFEKELDESHRFFREAELRRQELSKIRAALEANRRPVRVDGFVPPSRTDISEVRSQIERGSRNSTFNQEKANSLEIVPPDNASTILEEGPKKNLEHRESIEGARKADKVVSHDRPKVSGSDSSVSREPIKRDGFIFPTKRHKELFETDFHLNPEIAKSLENSSSRLLTPAFGYGPYLLDEYSIIVDKMPDGVSPGLFLKHILNDPDSINNRSELLKTADFHRRKEDLNRGPRLGDIYDIDMIGPDNGSVMLVDVKKNRFVFYTLETEATGLHPECGAREFGFEELPNGAVKFYVRGVSRSRNWAVKNYGGLAQHLTWTEYVKDLGSRLKMLGGEVRPDSELDWSKFVDLKPKGNF